MRKLHERNAQLQAVPLYAIDSKLMLTIRPAIGCGVTWSFLEPAKTVEPRPDAPRLLTEAGLVATR